MDHERQRLVLNFLLMTYRRSLLAITAPPHRPALLSAAAAPPTAAALLEDSTVFGIPQVPADTVTIWLQQLLDHLQATDQEAPAVVTLLSTLPLKPNLEAQLPPAPLLTGGQIDEPPVLFEVCDQGTQTPCGASICPTCFQTIRIAAPTIPPSERGHFPTTNDEATNRRPPKRPSPEREVLRPPHTPASQPPAASSPEPPPVRRPRLVAHIPGLGTDPPETTRAHAPIRWPTVNSAGQLQSGYAVPPLFAPTPAARRQQTREEAALGATGPNTNGRNREVTLGELRHANPGCWNCRELDHDKRDCTKPPQKHCFRCGNRGVTVASCSNNIHTCHREEPQL